MRPPCCSFLMSVNIHRSFKYSLKTLVITRLYKTTFSIRKVYYINLSLYYKCSMQLHIFDHIRSQLNSKPHKVWWLLYKSMAIKQKANDVNFIDPVNSFLIKWRYVFGKDIDKFKHFQFHYLHERQKAMMDYYYIDYAKSKGWKVITIIFITQGK